VRRLNACQVLHVGHSRGRQAVGGGRVHARQLHAVVRRGLCQAGGSYRAAAAVAAVGEGGGARGAGQRLLDRPVQLRQQVALQGVQVLQPVRLGQAGAQPGLQQSGV